MPEVSRADPPADLPDDSSGAGAVDFLTGPGPALDRRGPDGPVRGAVLLLHGGTQHSHEPVGGRSGSLRRMVWLRNAIAPRLLRDGYACWLLRFAERGWNGGGAPSPLPDARWALDELRAAHDVPVVLLGHSMGGRAAAYVADHPAVTGVVGLAPWFEPGDPVAALAGKHLVCGHGLRDRITSARLTERYVDRAREVAASAEFVPLGLAGHYMLYRPGMWNRFALTRCRGLLATAGEYRA